MWTVEATPEQWKFVREWVEMGHSPAEFREWVEREVCDRGEAVMSAPPPNSSYLCVEWFHQHLVWSLSDPGSTGPTNIVTPDCRALSEDESDEARQLLMAWREESDDE